jgi:hypothetical protein
MLKIGLTIAVFLFVLLLSTCVAPGRYTSLDLALLPCEAGESPKFFLPVEFDENGDFLYPHQQKELLDYLKKGTFKDLIFFTHGWNKNPASAELDYQSFICRFHAKLNDSLKDSKRQGKLKVVGIFWPSTITNRAKEPLLVKPVSYYKIRNRVDHLAVAGMAPLLNDVGKVLIDLDEQQGSAGEPRRMHLIGHSFGGRMMIRSLEKLSNDGTLVPILQSVEATNVLLLNAAAPPTFFDWIDDSVARAWKLGTPARFTPATSSFLLNVYSEQDSANKYLFRLASTFNDDPQTCAVGACGIPDVPTLCVDNAGKVEAPEPITSLSTPKLNVRNIDSSRIVYSHSDIYKGRVATLVADLLFDPETQQILNQPAPTNPDCG